MSLDRAKSGEWFGCIVDDGAKGSVYLNRIALKAGDGAKIQNESRLVLDRGQAAEVLVFDMA